MGSPTTCNMIVSRLVPYWLTVLACMWMLTFFYLWNTNDAYMQLDTHAKTIFNTATNSMVKDWALAFLGFIFPLLIATCFSVLLLTNATLPSWRMVWFNKVVAMICRFTSNDKMKNQFGIGEPDFNLMSFWLVFIPGNLLFVTYIHTSLGYLEEEGLEGDAKRKEGLLHISYLAGWVGIVLLSFFLIPVSRHSVLLVAMNWSPVHALRIHIWAGYLSFFYIFLHAITMLGAFLRFPVGPLHEEFIPPMYCWNVLLKEDEGRCLWQMRNLSGLIAFIFMLVLTISSLNWVRRNYYRIFYLLHVSMALLMLLASIWHFAFIGIYIFPSILYYMASTCPTLVQALASRFRGGVKISKVVVMEEAKCLEVHVLTDKAAHANLIDSHPSKFIKFCDPSISVVWHPFTVYAHPNDPTTLRFLFRAVGPFTSNLYNRLTAPTRPITMIDGLYKGGDHCQEALCHDHVTIIAGGVGITPFISMIDAVLTQLKASPKADDLKLMSITLVWACREGELLTYVRVTYLNLFVEKAQEIADFSMKIKIFHTGMPTKAMTDSETSSDDMSPGKDIIDCDNEFDKKKASNVQEMDKYQTIQYSSQGNVEGHFMELGRMQPGRFSEIKWNVPYFVVFSIGLWLGFHILFDPYQGRGKDFATYIEQTWVTAVSIVYFFIFGIVIEVGVLVLRSHWPSPRLDDFSLEAVSTGQKSLKEIKDEESGPIKPTGGDNVVVTMKAQRPDVEEMFEDATKAYAPGIFMCGPTGLTDMVRLKASTANSRLGCLTRYALYTEDFEM